MVPNNKDQKANVIVAQKPIVPAVVAGDKKLSKNAKRKLKRKEQETEEKKTKDEAKDLRRAIYDGINGYSQKEATKSISQEYLS